MPVNTGRPPNMVLSSLVTRRMGRMVLTKGGKEYLRRVVHPNDDTRAGGVMMPDFTDTARVPKELRQYQILSAPEGVTEGNWDCMFVILPHSDCTIAYRHRKSSGQGWSRWFLCGIDQVLQPGSIRAGNNVDKWSTTAVPDLRQEYTGYRQIFKGVTIEHNRSTLYDQGMVTAGQMVVQSGRRTDVVPYFTVPDGADFGTLDKVPAYVHEGIPVSDGDIIRWCPQATQWEAKKGIYMPMRYRDPTNLFDMDEQLIATANPNQGNVVDEVSTGALIVLKDIGDAKNALGDTAVGFDDRDINVLATTGALANQALGVIMFRGIDFRAQLVIKARCGVELVPKLNTKDSRNVLSPEEPDDVACKAVTGLFANMPVAYEHKYNSAGLLLGELAKLLPKVLPAVAPWLRGLLSPSDVSASVFPKGRYQEEDVD